MKIPFQFPTLAKLREFKSGGKVNDYLAKENRQNLKAIQESYADVVGVPVAISSINVAITTNQKYAFTPSNCYLMNEVGSLLDGVFYPKNDGIYFVEYGFQASIPGVAGIYGPNIQAQDNDGKVFDSLIGLTNKTSTDSEYIYPNTGLFMNITSKNGLTFYATISSASYITRFYCKITSLS